MSERSGSVKPWLKPPEPAGPKEADNALWRLPTWFPDTPSQTLEKLKVFHTELLKFNLKLNLIARTTEREADEVHFADCLMACQMISKHAPLAGKSIHDIGSGNGLPGIIMAIVSPAAVIHLVESDSRKCEFMKHAIHSLQLSNVKIMNVRLENLKPGDMSMGLTRGFASLSKTMLAFNKIFPKDGLFYHLKGPAWAREIAEIPSQIISAWRPELVGEYSLPVSQARRGIISTKKLT